MSSIDGFGNPIGVPEIGLDPERIRILSEEGRARIAAENAAKEAKREEKQEERMLHKGWKGKMQHGLELLKGKKKDNGVGSSSGLGKQDERGEKGEEESGGELMKTLCA